MVKYEDSNAEKCIFFELFVKNKYFLLRRDAWILFCHKQANRIESPNSAVTHLMEIFLITEQRFPETHSTYKHILRERVTWPCSGMWRQYSNNACSSTKRRPGFSHIRLDFCRPLQGKRNHRIWIGWRGREYVNNIIKYRNDN